MTNCRPTRRRLHKCSRRCRHQFTHRRLIEVDHHSDGGGVGSDRECTELGRSVVTNETHEASQAESYRQER